MLNHGSIKLMLTNFNKKPSLFQLCFYYHLHINPVTDMMVKGPNGDGAILLICFVGVLEFFVVSYFGGIGFF